MPEGTHDRSQSPRRVSSYPKSSPEERIAMSLKAAVGPLEVGDVQVGAFQASTGTICGSEKEGVE